MGKRYNIANLALREARAKGEKYYMSNFACTEGHKSKRVVSSNGCYECSKNRTIEHRKKLRHGPDGDAFRAKCKIEKQKWIEKGGDRVRELMRGYGRVGTDKYRKKNPLNSRVDSANLRAKKQGIEGKITPQEISEMLEKQGGKCAACEVVFLEGWDIDHIIPFRLRGLNKIENIQILCRPCNRSKGYLHPEHWRLLKETGSI